MAGVTRLEDVVYWVCPFFPAIWRFNATTHERLTNIVVKDLIRPYDVVACERTSQLYIADYEQCVWRVSSGGADIKRWLPKSPNDIFRPRSLSVTSTRLLVTSYDIHQLILFDSNGDELRRVQLRRYVYPLHAMESPTGTFIVSLINNKLKQGQVYLAEVNTGGKVLRQFSGSCVPSLGWTHVAVDSHGNIFVADRDNRLILDAHLFLRRVIIDDHQLHYKPPERLCYREQSGQLLVALYGEVGVFDVLCG